MIDRYAVVGNPIKHSKSPFIHKAFAQQTDQAMSYVALLFPLDDFAGSVARFRQEGGKGFNVTVPFKQDAFALMDTCTDRARLAGAVNTVSVRPDGSLAGDNTDGAGLVRDILNNAEGQLFEKRILILGAGGSVRGVLGPLLQQKPREIVIANRTLAKAAELADIFASQGRLRASGYETLVGPFDWIINATSASLHGDLPPLGDSLVSTDTWCYDMMYGKEPTVFLQWALARGAAHTMDGLGMLVEQAAESFRTWRGILPATEPVIMELRAMMKSD